MVCWNARPEYVEEWKIRQEINEEYNTGMKTRERRKEGYTEMGDTN